MDADDILLGNGLTRAGPAEATRLGDITADAFRHDPFNHWLFGNFAGIKHLFLLQARRIYSQRGYCYTLGDQGACMWMMPGGDSSFSTGDYVAFALPTLFKCGPGAVKRGILTGEAMDKRHPTFAHAYLFSIGLRQSAQGQGFGRRLIQPVLDACDRTGTIAYLENSNPANTGFYASCGFEPMGEPIVPETGAPPLVPMARQPRRS
ncbi:GNAT family N-acetyltransferase [Qipengyuania sp. 6B39]|uniref:GNAT family N-acetyltransferase n=1 Tax=Qipengyuania proteolytica TaxID=2867239 RepID=UPI001C8906A8|nr:GNAT family N-acetyltransferase [Qipengyuania proteolytica]MBX7495876.1 GNAT family N-acetyltransferase [Qipengyuania proteolytica]